MRSVSYPLRMPHAMDISVHKSHLSVFLQDKASNISGSLNDTIWKNKFLHRETKQHMQQKQEQIFQEHYKFSKQVYKVGVQELRIGHMRSQDIRQ